MNNRERIVEILNQIIHEEKKPIDFLKNDSPCIDGLDEEWTYKCVLLFHLLPDKIEGCSELIYELLTTLSELNKLNMKIMGSVAIEPVNIANIRVYTQKALMIQVKDYFEEKH